MSDNFYRAFEDRHRGSRELIKSRLAVYLPFIKPLHHVYQQSPVLDLGCGRGEWLEVISGEGIPAMGIDSNQGMLGVCYEIGLPVEQGDAIVYLSSLADDSQTTVSAFHLVEHLAFDQLRTLVSEALRVLKPGGLLIMETPNPENIVVGTCNFYIDPTHQRPIPSQLLSFLPEHYGFNRTKVLRLHESKDIAENETPTLQDVLGGVSPDYAVIAQKHASPEILSLFDELFSHEYGLTLNTLAARYDHAIASKAQQAEDKAQQAEGKAQQAATHLNDVLNSTSWRIMAPARWFISSVRGVKAPQIALKPQLKLLLQHARLYVGRRTWLKQKSLIVLNQFPNIKSRLIRAVPCNMVVVQTTLMHEVPADLAHLTPRARQIYADLTAAIERHKRENG